MNSACPGYENLVAELAELRYRDATAAGDIRIKPGTDDIGERPPEGGDWQIVELGSNWGGLAEYVWLAIDADIPDDWSDRTIVGRFDFGRTDYGNASGFEGLLFINGEVEQGVDSNHTEVIFPQSVAGQTVSLRFRLWSGYGRWGAHEKQTHTLRRAEVAWLDQTTDDLYFSAKAILETIRVAESDGRDSSSLQNLLSTAFGLVDFTSSGGGKFYDTVESARNILREGLANLTVPNDVTIHCVGHSHIDVAWLWRLRHTREKLARTFSTALKLLDQNSSFIFLQSQPQLYEYLKSDYPELFEDIRLHVSSGRWEPCGAMWVEPDCNIPSGESLVRQLLFGKQFLQDEFNIDCNVMWLPDVFGFSASLPQILKKAGVDTFVTTKLSWNDTNRMPHDTFLWRGLDGSEVLAHFITTPMDLPPLATYSAEITAATLQGTWNDYRDKALNRDLLLAYGYGDGGGGVNREMLEMRRRFEEIPGNPRAIISRANDYFDKLKDRLSDESRRIGTWDGELYLERHRGTYTSQAKIKRANRKLEFALRDSEWLGVIARLASGPAVEYPRVELNEAWKILLRNQFHDILPGTSIGEVYEDAEREFERAQRLVEAAQNCIRLDADARDKVTLFNSASWRRRECLFLGSEVDMCERSIVDVAGNPLASQQIAGGWLVESPWVPAMGWATLYLGADAAERQLENTFEFSGKSITSRHYRIEWNSAGQLTSVWCRDTDRELLASGQPGNVLQVFEDKSAINLDREAWAVNANFEDKQVDVTELVSVEPIERGPLRAVIRFVWTYASSTISQDLVLYRISPRIDFVTDVNWQERRKMMKVAFPVDVRAAEATFDIQFGNVRRPTHRNTSWDKARFEVCAHQWADLSERGFGVSLINDCKYGYDVKDNVLRLTLLKSPALPDPHADKGDHRFTYSVLPHQGDWLAGNTVREAWAVNSPLKAMRGSLAKQEFSLFHVDADHVMIDTVKLAERSGSIVLRLHEFGGRRGPIVIDSELQISSWQECDLLEVPSGDLVQTRRINREIRPYEILTLLVEVQHGIR